MSCRSAVPVSSYDVAGIGAISAFLVIATVIRNSHGVDAVAWSLCQLVLVGIAWVDLRTNLIRTDVLIFAAGVFIALRSVYEPDALVETVVVGFVGLAAFALLAALSKGGLGMGDAYLVGLLGLMLGSSLVFALLAGAVAGSLAALALVLSRRASLQSSFAYGPYLALGASLAILFASPPPLV
jgi:leader peptidase (prepilin peptidase)/N-methyltransferase